MSGRPDGYNPMRWECETKGCFNLLCRPKIEMFADCFPRNIGMGDQDAFVELNFHILKMEWKGMNANPTEGQWLAMRRETAVSPAHTCIVVEGAADIMIVWGWKVISRGRVGEYRKGGLEDLKQWFKDWVRYAQEDNSFREAYIKEYGTELL